MTDPTERLFLIIHEEANSEGRRWELYQHRGDWEPGFLSPEPGLQYMLQKHGAHLEAPNGRGAEYWTIPTYVHPALAASHELVRHIVIQFAFERLSKYEPELVTYQNERP